MLAGGDALSARYRFSLVERNDEVVRIRLDPTADVGETLELAMEASSMDLLSVTMTDPAGSVTFVEFGSGQRNVDLDESLFSFTPPRGIDIITSP